MSMAKNAVITGSNRGIGKSLVRVFAENGYNIWACVRKPGDEFERELAELADSTGAEIKPVYFDLSDEAEIKRGMREIFSEKRPVDVLINNAGIAYGAPMNMTSMAKLRDIFEVNVFAQVQIMQLVSRRMIARKSGNIINMCSVSGIETTPGSFAYGASKASLIWITRLAAAELGEYNIRVNGIAPGYIDTEMGRMNGDESITVERAALKRLGSPEEIAKTALFLASEDASFITGQIISADGGRIL